MPGGVPAEPEGLLSVQQPLRRLPAAAGRRSARASSAGWRSSTNPRRGTAPAAIRAGSARAASRTSPTSATTRSASRGTARSPPTRTLPFTTWGSADRCGRDLARPQEYCGEFRVPTLRNVALRRAFFHNGQFHRLDQVLEFYVARDTNPGKWYAKADGRVEPFDDLPPAYKKNVNTRAPVRRQARCRAGAEQGRDQRRHRLPEDADRRRPDKKIAAAPERGDGYREAAARAALGVTGASARSSGRPSPCRRSLARAASRAVRRRQRGQTEALGDEAQRRAGVVLRVVDRPLLGEGRDDDGGDALARAEQVALGRARRDPTARRTRRR